MSQPNSGFPSTQSQSLWNDRNLLVIFSVTLIAIQGVASLTPAFPKMAQVLNISPSDIGLLITFFTLPGVILSPILGIMADRYGRKKILIPSLVLYGIAGTACFFWHQLHLLLIFRFFQGVGAAAIGALNITLIGDLYAGRDRATAMGYNASVLSIGTAAYPIIGGAMASIGWYYPFLLPLLALPVAIFVLIHLKNPEPKSTGKLSTYLLSTWKSVANKAVLGVFTVSVGTFILLYGVFLVYFPLLMDQLFHAPPFVIGLVISTASVSTAITAMQLGWLTSKFSERSMIKMAFLFYALTLILMLFMQNIWAMLLPTIIFGIAQGLNMPSLQTLLTTLAPMDQRAAILSLNGMVLRIGQTLGPFLMGLVYTVWQMNGVFIAGIALSIAMIGVVSLTIAPRILAPPPTE